MKTTVSNELLLDAFERIKETVHETAEALTVEDLTFRPTESANTIGWLIWHLTRIQDDHIADVALTQQIWAGGWSERFALPFDETATGYDHTSDEVASVRANAELLLGYFDAVHAATRRFIEGLSSADYERIVDTRWNPPVSLAVRLVSVIADDLQHAGQAAYIRGLLPDARA